MPRITIMSFRQANRLALLLLVSFNLQSLLQFRNGMRMLGFKFFKFFLNLLFLMSNTLFLISNSFLLYSFFFKSFFKLLNLLFQLLNFFFWFHSINTALTFFPNQCFGT